MDFQNKRPVEEKKTIPELTIRKIQTIGMRIGLKTFQKGKTNKQKNQTKQTK